VLIPHVAHGHTSSRAKIAFGSRAHDARWRSHTRRRVRSVRRRCAEQCTSPSVVVTLRSIHSRAARKLEAKQMKRDRQKLVAKGFVLDPDDVDANELEMCASALVVAWQGVATRAGQPVPCTPAAVTEVLRDLPAFRRDILSAARQEETFRAAAAESAGNSSTASGTPSSSTAA